MKSRFSVTFKVLTACSFGFNLCCITYYLMDTVWNGSFVDWFESRFVIREKEYIPELKGYILTYSINWSRFKLLLLELLIVGVIICLCIAVCAADRYARRRVTKTVGEISQMIRICMQQEGGELSEMFPEKYAEIYVQMAYFKAMVRHHEQMRKEEVSRKNDLITYLAHDLKTPLTSVIGYLTLLKEAPDMPEKQRARYINIALDKASRLEDLTNEFFEITRYNLQQIALEMESIDLYYMMVQLADEFYPVLSAHRNTVRLDIDEDLMIYGDAEKLARVFNNILKNAVSYSYRDTEIEICARATKTETRICFRNRGKTIPPQKLDALFEKFFRLDEARTANTGGAGLGLAIAKEIVTLHGGTIQAESENETTIFLITLPRS